MTGVYRPQNGDDCVYSAISVLRSILGYKTAFPKNVYRPRLTDIEWIVSCAPSFFPRHSVESWMKLPLEAEYVKVHGLGDTPSPINVRTADLRGPYVFMYDYLTFAEFAWEQRWHSHTVVGYPRFYVDMTGMFIVRVSTSPK